MIFDRRYSAKCKTYIIRLYWMLDMQCSNEGSKPILDLSNLCLAFYSSTIWSGRPTSLKTWPWFTNIWLSAHPHESVKDERCRKPNQGQDQTPIFFHPSDEPFLDRRTLHVANRCDFNLKTHVTTISMILPRCHPDKWNNNFKLRTFDNLILLILPNVQNNTADHTLQFLEATHI